jgi:GT2 family glycosyltransferase
MQHAVTKLVYLIILNWNGWKDTVECVESCQRLTYDGVRILIVDNGSTDGSESILRERFPPVEFLQTGQNLGYAGGNNAGIRYALERGAGYVWLLNNDTVVEHDSLSELMKVATLSEQTGIVGSKIYYYDEPQKIWFAGGIWDKSRSFTSHRGMNENDIGQYEDISEVGFISGCSLLAKSAMISKIGMMKEDYFLYWEDVDWNATATEQGWKILFAPRSRIRHKVSSSTKDKSLLQSYYFMRSGLLFFQRHAPLKIIPFFLRVMSYAISCYRKGQRAVLQGYSSGTKDYLLRRFGHAP